jgi:hypothetical protein
MNTLCGQGTKIQQSPMRESMAMNSGDNDLFLLE